MNNKILTIFNLYRSSMKYLWLVIILIFSFSCKPKQSVLSANSTNTISVNCPENGKCSFEVLQNKKLNILKDDLGKTYPNIVEGNQLVLKFEFEKNTDLKAVDAHYIEQVFIELDPDNLEKETANLKSETILFARLCFCRGQTGYYKVHSGHLSIKSNEGTSYKIDLHFKAEEVPQVITSINQIFSLK